MNIDDEAERLARVAGWEKHHPLQTVRRDAYQPEHRAPRRPKPIKEDEAVLRARADADLQAMWDQDDGKTTRVFGGLLDGMDDMHVDLQHAQRALMQRALHDLAAYGVSTLMRVPMGLGKSRDMWEAKLRESPPLFAGFDFAREPLKPRDPPPQKTYVQPGKRPGRTWIARLEQSKKAKR